MLSDSIGGFQSSVYRINIALSEFKKVQPILVSFAKEGQIFQGSKGNHAVFIIILNDCILLYTEIFLLHINLAMAIAKSVKHSKSNCL